MSISLCFTLCKLLFSSPSIVRLLPPSRPTGLFEDEASLALSTHGPNVPSSSAPVGNWTLFFRASLNPFNLLLGVLAIVSVATGDYPTFSIMVLMVVISSGLRYDAFLLDLLVPLRPCGINITTNFTGFGKNVSLS